MTIGENGQHEAEFSVALLGPTPLYDQVDPGEVPDKTDTTRSELEHGIHFSLAGLRASTRRPGGIALITLVSAVGLVSVLAGLTNAHSLIASPMVAAANAAGRVSASQVEASIEHTSVNQVSGVEHNADWKPVSKTFSGIEMVLVPAGCMMMGSEAGSHDELPVHQQCFDEPFWIDRTEMTNGQLHSRGYWSGSERPRENVTWFMAQEFCESRGGRLPTEAEWEYAARGPDGLEYPWGNTFDGSKVIWYTFETKEVGSKPDGASWVGALDMSGGVWEWVSSIYWPYPYDPADGREADGGLDNIDRRVLRGGSWEITDAANLRAANRFSADPDDWGYGLIGFRCARSN
jgi:formylglycine-generating enzyme required for sulfatase activity